MVRIDLKETNPVPPLFRFVIYRLLAIPLTLLVITLVLYGFVMLTPPEVRATLYFPSGFNPDRMTPEQVARYTEHIIQLYHLREPFPIQYTLWASRLVRGDWGWSPVLNEDVLPALLRRTPVTLELTIYSLLIIIPLGIISGVLAGSRKNSSADHRFRSLAFFATSTPPFILAIVLMSIFYVMLHWFPPERISTHTSREMAQPAYQVFTGLLTVDGLLNGRADISLDALRHLVLPVITLSLVHWATLGRVTRARVIEELQKDYILAGRARGIPNAKITWRHALRNSLAPAMTSVQLSAAALFTGVFIVEVIYNFKGVSSLVPAAMQGETDAATVLGFAVYSVVVVLAVMFVMDLIQALLDPRVREGVLDS
jgi:peptide/nickel transport system permease protein